MQKAGLPRNQIFGSGTFLDTQRLRLLIAQKIKVAPQSVDAYILGEHGDSQFAAWSCANIEGIPLESFSSVEQAAVENAVREKAYEIIACKGATFFGIAASVALLCEAIIFNKRFVAPLSTYHEGWGICLSMPVILGEKGIEEHLSIPLNKSELEKLNRSVKMVQSQLRECGL
jgi:L-lactate dehydrogenase